MSKYFTQRRKDRKDKFDFYFAVFAPLREMFLLKRVAFWRFFVIVDGVQEPAHDQV